jgi:hypothetical protein
VTYGTESTFYRLFLYFGMPFGCFFFDFLMFLGPFGLLPIVPMPEAMRLFVPACTHMRGESSEPCYAPTWLLTLLLILPIADAATRMIAEVIVEALPQWIMQAIIFVMVSMAVHNGTASVVDTTLYEYKDGTFISLMPKSILISTFSMLKTWFDLVQEVRTLHDGRLTLVPTHA